MHGAACTDGIDGPIIPTPSGTVDTSQVGIHVLIYSCIDAAGNAAEPVSRIVIVQSEPGTPLTGPAGLAVHAESIVDAREGDPVTLSGSATGAPRDSLTYRWAQTSAQDPPVSFGNASARTTTFTAPQVNGATTFDLYPDCHERDGFCLRHGKRQGD